MSVKTLINIIDSIIIIGMNGSTCVYMLVDDLMQAAIGIMPLKSQQYALHELGGWAGRWCWVASSAGRPATFAYSRARAYCACRRCGTGGLYFYIFHLSSLF